MAEGAIRSVVVAGGGIVGWSAAAALKRRLPLLEVTIVPTPPPSDSLAERVAATLPSILGFHGDIGLGDDNVIARALSGIRLGTEHHGWSGDRPDYVHGYAPHGRPFGTTSFHHQWLRIARDGGAPPFDSFSPAAELARTGRFAPEGEPGSPLGSVEFGLVLDLPRYEHMLQAYARHLGVQERAGTVADLRLRGGDGFAEALLLGGGAELAADLFVDCTGPGAALLSRLDPRFEDWSGFLPCDRVALGEAPPPPQPELLDRVAAVAGGWRWRSPGLTRTTHGVAYASSRMSDDDSARLLREAGAAALFLPVALRQGRRPEPWVRNCVAVGDSAASIEPLEWTNLHLAHSAIDRIVAMMPSRGCAPVELAEYNRQTLAESERVRDFLMLHYVVSERPEPFWSEAAARPLPPSLEHSLSLFRERGRLPHYEEETFSRDSWLAVLFGQGVMPRRVDPLAESLDKSEARSAMERMRASLSAAVAAAPPYGAFLSDFMRQNAR